jgi:hypothetical protein
MRLQHSGYFHALGQGSSLLYATSFRGSGVNCLLSASATNEYKLGDPQSISQMADVA